MTTKRYIQIGLVTGIIIFLISQFAGPQLIGFIQGVRSRADPSAITVATLVVEPIIFVLSNGIITAIICAVLWPLVLGWLGLLLFLIVVVALQGGFSSLRESNVIN